MRRIVIAYLVIASISGLALAQAYSTVGGYGSNIVSGVYNAVAPTVTGGQTSPLQLDVNGNLLTMLNSYYTYSASFNGLVPPATPTDFFCITGSASKTIFVKRIDITGTASTQAVADLLVIRRSAANTGGTSTTATAASHDSTNPAATATVTGYTANPSALGASAGTIDAFKITLAAVTAQVNERIKTYGVEDMQAVRLRGTNEQLCLNANGVTNAGNNYDVAVDWIER